MSVIVAGWDGVVGKHSFTEICGIGRDLGSARHVRVGGSSQGRDHDGSRRHIGTVFAAAGARRM